MFEKSWSAFSKWQSETKLLSTLQFRKGADGITLPEFAADPFRQMFVPTVRDVHQRQSEAEECLADSGRGENITAVIILHSLTYWKSAASAGTESASTFSSDCFLCSFE